MLLQLYPLTFEAEVFSSPGCGCFQVTTPVAQGCCLFEGPPSTRYLDWILSIPNNSHICAWLLLSTAVGYMPATHTRICIRMRTHICRSGQPLIYHVVSEHPPDI